VIDKAGLPTIRVASYKSLKDEVEIRLRPLTMLYGRNQAGKSTLLRLLPLVADCLQPGVPALDLQSPALRGATFKELGWLGQDPTYSPRLTFIATEVEHEPTYQIELTDQDGCVPNRIELRHGPAGDKFKVSLDGLPERTATQIRALYAGNYKGKEWSGELEFSSLVPSGLPDEAQTIVSAVALSLECLKRIQWLIANRLFEHQPSVRNARCCSPDGSNLATLLKANDPVLKLASDWLAHQDRIGVEVSVQADSTGQVGFEIRPAGGERLPLRLAGEGLRALLPILICASWADTKQADSPSMLAIEEPESNLHPNLQIALFDRLVETCRASVPVILETHSVYMLRAMQRAVLRGDLQPQDIGLYWLDQADGAASCTEITVIEDATLEGWLPGEFEQEQELAREIMQLRWDRGAPE